MNKAGNKVKSLVSPILVTLVLLVICGLLFPLALSGLGHIFFGHQAGGNLVEVNGKTVGAEYVGQDFTEDYFMKGRPSAVNYNTYTEDENGDRTYMDGSEFGGLASGSQNLSPSSPELKERVEADMAAFLEANPDVRMEDIPADLMTASGSGLDPHISPDSAMVQIPALSDASGLSEEELTKIVEKNTKGRFLGLFGEETVNVLHVNIDIADSMGLI